jgi:Erv1 / Alr family
MKIGPEVWGEPMWKTLHIVALSYPSNPDADTAEKYKQFFMLFRSVIPCQSCAQGYGEILNRHPIDEALGGPEDLFNWTVVVHNEVANKINKPTMSPEFVKHNYIFGTSQSQPQPQPKQQSTVKPYVYIYAASGVVCAICILWMMYVWYTVDAKK